MKISFEFGARFDILQGRKIFSLRFQEESRSSASSERESCLFSELDLLNPRYRSKSLKEGR